MISDMHDGTVADGDKWLANMLPAVLSSDSFNKGGVSFLMWDEGGGCRAAGARSLERDSHRRWRQRDVLGTPTPGLR